jgi:hypothetical protein
MTDRREEIERLFRAIDLATVATGGFQTGGRSFQGRLNAGLKGPRYTF